MNLFSILLLSTLTLLAVLFFRCFWKNFKPAASNVWQIACLFWRGIMTIRHSAFIIALALFAFALRARAQSQVGIYQPTTLLNATNLPAVISPGGISNTVSIINVPQKLGLSFTWKFNVSAGSSNACESLTPSVDGTNYDTTPWTLNRNANGTTDVIATTNWTHNQLNSYRTLKIVGQTNQNAGTLTNKQNAWGFENP